MNGNCLSSSSRTNNEILAPFPLELFENKKIKSKISKNFKKIFYLNKVSLQISKFKVLHC